MALLEGTEAEAWAVWYWSVLPEPGLLMVVVVVLLGNYDGEEALCFCRIMLSTSRRSHGRSSPTLVGSANFDAVFMA